MLKLVGRSFSAILLCMAAACAAQTGAVQKKLDPAQVAAIRSHISSTWDVLTRSMSDCKTVTDPKMPSASILYLPAEYKTPPAVEKAQQDCHIQVKRLPKLIHGPGEVDTNKFDPHGLLYLENDYVVPGGSFNEMYGWDSYFIVRGLVSDGRVALARGMVDNFFFEIEHYGTILNANRTYYLTRAQPPFLTAMIMSVYEADKAAGKADNAWLAKAYGYANKDYAMWTHAPHLAGNTGLSRFYDFGSGLTPESLVDEEGVQRAAVAYFVAHPEEGHNYIAPLKAGENGSVYDPAFTVEVCDTPSSATKQKCETKTTLHMTEEYWHGDRAMRESGYDLSFRFGPYGAGAHHFAPVCLNSLLYKTEKDMETMARILGHTQEAKQWSERAASRAATMRKLLWDPARGGFFDYDFEAGKRSEYQSAITFYPLWAGWATPEQARAVQKNIGVFERAGGIVASTLESGVQWDYPYGWAPQQLFAAEGLRNYKMDSDADRISIEFLSTVMDDYKRVGSILEKYNMLTRSSDVNVAAGYTYNADGFGWTNGVFLVLLEKLPK
jgi:alpha,alpha-trehalase